MKTDEERSLVERRQECARQQDRTYARKHDSGAEQRHVDGATSSEEPAIARLRLLTTKVSARGRSWTWRQR